MTTARHGLMRIFWPSDAPRDNTSGVLVGWRNSDWDVLVVSVLQGVEVRNVEHALRMRSLFRGSPHPIENILDRCGKQPVQVLGTLDSDSSPKPFDPKLLSLFSSRRSRAPHVYCPEDAQFTIQMIVFDPPNPKGMQFLSLRPISLALGDTRNAFEDADPIDLEEEKERTRKEELVAKLKMHTVVRHPKTHKELSLPTIIVQMNCSAELDALMQQNIYLVGVRMKRTISVSERVVESATNLWDSMWLSVKQAFIHHVWPFVSQLFILYLMALRIAAELILTLLDWKPFRHAALKDVSATAQQLDIRLQQFCYWPSQYVTLHRRRADWVSFSNSHPEYIRFFNSLWLVANDIIIGITLGSYIIDNADLVAAQLDRLINTYSIEGLQQILSWLMDYPAGLKLNNELAEFLGDLFLWVIEYWNGCMSQFRPALPYVIRLIGLSSFAGASMPISLFSDLLSLLTLHIYSFYIASARIYNWQLTIIISLFHLFRGKKRNILRHRIDSCDYDLDQLLLGTILFTLLFFLLPTVAVFYVTFAGARMGIIALKAALDIWLACLNHFPLFALMLRIKDSRRLPGGIRFEILDTPRAYFSATSSSSPVSQPHHSGPPVPVSYIKLKSIPLPLSQTFAQYAQLGHRLRKHYLSPGVFLCLVSGQLVPPIPRKNLYSLQYSMLPVQRVSIATMWQLLTADRAAPPDHGHANGHISAGPVNGVPGAGGGGGKKSKVKAATRQHW